jgi:hypothetical protein
MTTAHTTAASEFIDHGSETYAFLQDPVVDALMQVVIELGAESWITRRRLLVLERVLAERGLVASDLVETYTPSPEDETAWRQERDRMLRGVYAALARRPMRGDEAAERAKSPDAPRKPPLNATDIAARAPTKGPSGV